MVPITTLLMLVAIIKVEKIHSESENFPVNNFINFMQALGAQEIVLNSCQYKPLYYINLREEFNFYYKCGSHVARIIPTKINRIGFWSGELVTETKIYEQLNFFTPRPVKVGKVYALGDGGGYIYDVQIKSET